MIFCKTCDYRRNIAYGTIPVFPKYLGAIEEQYQIVAILNKNNDCKHFKKESMMRKLIRTLWM